MSAPEVGNVVLQGMDDGYDFIVVNFANGDMVGHTGNFDAAVKAVEAVDNELGRIVNKCKEKGYNLILTSDHGNCEELSFRVQLKKSPDATTAKKIKYLLAELEKIDVNLETDEIFDELTRLIVLDVEDD